MNQEFCKIHTTLIHKPAIQNNDLHGHVTHGSQLIMIIPKYHAYLTCQIVTQNKYTLYVTTLGVGTGVLKTFSTCAVRPL